jgi:putative modified peptide
METSDRPIPPLPQKRLPHRRLSVNMTPTEAYEFGVKLATDDEFRARLQADPVAVLAEHHIYLPPREITTEVHLPSKEDVRAAMESIISGGEFRRAFLPDAVPDLIIFFFFIL